MKLVSKYALGVAAFLGLVIAGGTYKLDAAKAASDSDWGPKWADNGNLILPVGYHEWVFVGSPLTPNALNDGKAGFPEYHNVYIQPQAYSIYKETGTFPEGTIMLKELQLTQPGENEDGSRSEVSGRGYFPAARNGIDIAVKDSKRFSESKNWGYFNFGHHAPPYKATAAAAPVANCAQCHIDNATKDMVFTKFYAILN
ncbi:MAG: chain A cytochrome P460 [Alphaproteobacteria bacterium]|nr:chain A cytochrome P460 [Alphaproteobacteria bacterium]